jgi:hypothetical protein
VNSIAEDFAAKPGKASRTAPPTPAPMDAKADFVFFRRRYTAKQQAMETSIGALRGRLREAAAGLSLYALYRVVGIVPPEVYRPSFLLIALVLIAALYGAASAIGRISGVVVAAGAALSLGYFLAQGDAILVKDLPGEIRDAVGIESASKSPGETSVTDADAGVTAEPSRLPAREPGPVQTLETALDLVFEQLQSEEGSMMARLEQEMFARAMAADGGDETKATKRIGVDRSPPASAASNVAKQKKSGK